MAVQLRRVRSRYFAQPDFCRWIRTRCGAHNWARRWNPILVSSAHFEAISAKSQLAWSEAVGVYLQGRRPPGTRCFCRSCQPRDRYDRGELNTLLVWSKADDRLKPTLACREEKSRSLSRLRRLTTTTTMPTRPQTSRSTTNRSLTGTTTRVVSTNKPFRHWHTSTRQITSSRTRRLESMVCFLRLV